MRAWEDGRTEVTAADNIGDAPSAVALAVADGLDGSAWRQWVAAQFGFDALDVGEDVARGHAEDLATGAALWALAETKRRAVVVPPVVPGSPRSLDQDPASSMGDFGDGQTMSDFGDGQSMSDFTEPAQMSDFGEGNQMGDFGDGQSMSEVESGPEPAEPAGEPLPEAPAKRIPKARVAVAAAVAVAVVAVTAVVVAAANSDESPEVPVAVTAPTTAPTTTTTTVPAERTFDVTFTITSTNADEFPDAPLKTGLTGAGTIALTCEGETCRFDFDATDPKFGHAVDGVTLDGSSLIGTEQSVAPAQGLHGDCERQHTRSVTASMSEGSISGDALFTADPLTCPGPDRNTLHVYTFTFEGTEAAAVAPQELETAPAAPLAGSAGE